MKIAVFSDTHGKLHNLAAAMNQLGKIDACIHLGDCVGDAKKIAATLNVPMYNVRGNCDFTSSVVEEAVFTFDGVRILCVHGHLYRDVSLLYYRAQELNCQAALCGHTHVPDIDFDGKILLLNPGSLTKPRFGSKPGFALLTIEKGRVYGQLFSV